MARAKREIPHFYLGTTVDMTRALAWLGAENARRPVTDRLLPAVLLIKAVALALREVPELNGFWEEGALPGRGPASTRGWRFRCEAAAWSRRRFTTRTSKT